MLTEAGAVTVIVKVDPPEIIVEVTIDAGAEVVVVKVEPPMTVVIVLVVMLTLD